MRRSFNPKVPDTRTNDCLEVTRRLYRAVMDIAKRLDEQKNCALSVTDIFTPAGEGLRAKLKDYCERLIFKDPIGHASKTEELLWRKGFYEAVSVSKKLRKGNIWNETEKALLLAHLAAGVGFYHHLILRLQWDYDLDLYGVIDFAYPRHKATSLMNQKLKASQSKLPSDDIRQCAMRIIHRSLVCLGDLARYKLDLDPTWNPSIATRYYKIAVSINPSIGMPHNQLGTLAGNKNYGLDAVYHYTRCILCAESFEGAEGNLKRIIAAHSYTGKEKTSFQKCTAKLFSLLQLWDKSSSDAERINQDCQDLLIEFEKCLTAERNGADETKSASEEESIEAYLQSCKNEQTPDLTDDMIFKTVAICLMSIAKLKSKESGEVQGAVAFLLTILSQLMQIAITRVQRAIMDVDLPVVMDGKLLFLDDNEISPDTEIKNEINDETLKSRDESRVDLNDNEKKKVELRDEKINGDVLNRRERKVRDKSKSLLTKLRRRRKRISSSDSDGSDIDGVRVGSSSDEMNSDISETDEDEIMSDCNAVSDEAQSEDLTDDETKPSCDGVTMNGHRVDDDKEKEEDDEKVILENGEKSNESDDTREKNMINSESAVTVTTNGSSHEENSADTLFYLALAKKRHLGIGTIIEILGREGALQSIKISFDWLRGNPETFRMFAKSSGASLKRLATLLNLVNLNELEPPFADWERDSVLTSSAEKLRESTEKVPLPEDMDLRGLKLFQEAHKKLDWLVLKHTRMYEAEETLLRARKLIDFGHFVCTISDSGIKYDEEKKLFVSSDPKKETSEESSNETERSKGKLMRHMGRLWLKAEVRALESRLRSRLISPYLVPDHEALAKHTPALKRLVYAKKFIVIIPTVVVSALDEMKKTSSKVREATRWLEGQLRKGSRFLRAQRPHERLPLPLIKGPRTKDKEAWLFFQIIECCHYLTQQTKVGLNGDKEPPVVTLLTGFSAEERKAAPFSPDGLSKTAGVNLEHIESFHTKWKNSSKSHG